MAFDPHFAARIREALGVRPLVEKRMFGGLGFLADGNMICGIFKNDLILRVPPEQLAALLKRPGAKPFVMRDKPSAGWLLVDADAVKTKAALAKWVALAAAHVATMPKKTGP